MLLQIGEDAAGDDGDDNFGPQPVSTSGEKRAADQDGDDDADVGPMPASEPQKKKRKGTGKTPAH